MSRSMLSLRLKQLEDAGVVTRNNGTSGLEYHLTDQGKEFAPIVHLLGEWGQRRYRTDFRRDELDVGLLMWDMRRRVIRNVFHPVAPRSSSTSPTCPWPSAIGGSSAPPVPKSTCARSIPDSNPICTWRPTCRP